MKNGRWSGLARNVTSALVVLRSQFQRWPWRSWAKCLGGALLATYVLYVLLVASFLSFGGMAWATKNEADVHVEVDSGYSFFPGRVHLRGLKLRVKDYNIEMEVLLDSAEASLALWKLPFKTLHVYWVHAHGAEYKLVHRVVDPVANAERLAAFPEIPGFDRPLYYDSPKEPPTGAKLWTVRFDSIEADVRRAWLLEYRLRAKMQARGAFFLDPSREARVWPCRVDVEDGELFVRDQRIAQRVQGTLSAEVSSFDPVNALTLDVIPKLSAGIERASAELDTLSFTELYVRSERVAWSGKGQLSVDVRMKQGQIQGGSTAQLDLSPTTLQAGVGNTHGTGRAVLRTPVDGQLDTEASLFFPEEEKQAFSARVLEAKASLEHQVITDVSLRRASLVVERLQFKAPDFLYGAFGKRSSLPSSGAFDAQAFLDLPKHGDVTFDADVAARSTSFYLSGLQLGVTADGRAHCQGTRAEAECSLEARAPYLLFDQQPSQSAATLWLRARSKEALKVSLDNNTLSGTLQLSGGDPKAVVSELMGEDWIAQLGLTLVPTGQLAGTLHLNRTPQRLSLSADLASGGSRVQGHTHTSGATFGAWVVDMPSSRWGFEMKPDGVSSHPFVGSDWLTAH